MGTRTLTCLNVHKWNKNKKLGNFPNRPAIYPPVCMPPIKIVFLEDQIYSNMYRNFSLHENILRYFKTYRCFTVVCKIYTIFNSISVDVIILAITSITAGGSTGSDEWNHGSIS